MQTIHMIGHGHIDPVWLWRWQEGYEEVRATFRSALDRMRECDAMCFTASSACFYAWVKGCDPAMFEEIRARVAEGRWEIAGGWWIEPDCNIPCGESFVRQGLYGQRFFMREFGKRAAIGFNPDSFGHSGTFPQILLGQGMRHYVYMRPNPGHDGGERAYPDGTTFVWRAPDGSEVLASVIQESYNSTDNVPECLEYLKDCPHLNPGQQHVMGFYGVGNHGGGPTKRAIAGILEAQKKTEPRVKFSTLEKYFSAFEAAHSCDTLPIIADELQHHARGCYSAHAGVKHWVRQTEHALMTAERIAVIAWQKCGLAYPKAELEAAWKTLLFNQFHDILAGTSLEAAYEDARDQIGAARHSADTITNQAVQVMARQMDTSALGNSIVLFNPLPWPVRQCVTPSPLVMRTLGDCVQVVDANGKHIAHQAVLGPHVGSKTICFMADVPALGYAVYNVQSVARADSQISDLKCENGTLENKWWRIELDPNEGCISCLYDKVNQVVVLQRGSRLLCIADPSDTWSHRVIRYDGEVSAFGNARVDILESGPVRATLRVQSNNGKSQAQQYITIYEDDPAIDIRYRVNWQEQYTMLKLAFETHITDPSVACECAYGVQERSTNGEEEPMQQWVDVSGKIAGTQYGLAILNDGKYGYDCLNGDLRISCLRSPAYAHHDPDPYIATEPFSIMDQGGHNFAMRLIPHMGDWHTADLAQRAAAWNAPLIAHIESTHTGDWPQQQSFLSCDTENILWTVLKQSEDGENIILRGYETRGRITHCKVHLFGVEIKVSFQKFEIKTLLVDRVSGIVKCFNLLEEITEG